jgi:hypothetical protein
MAKGNEDQLITWLEEKQGKVILPHVGVLTKIERIGKVNDNRKKADVKLNDIGVSLKNVESSFLYNRAHRSHLLQYLQPSDIKCLDQQIQYIHNNNTKRNIKWQTVLTHDRFKALLQILMMQMNPRQGISQYPATLILTHPTETQHMVDISVYGFEEFFNIFAENWITFAFRRCFYGQKNQSESGRAKRIMNDPDCFPWVLDGVSGKGPQEWSPDAPPPEKRKTCFTCSIAIRSPVSQWETLREFRLSLLESGFFGVDSETLERVTHKVKEHFRGKLVHKQDDEKWTEVLKIADQILSKRSNE